MLDFAAGRPSTVTLPERIASVASERLAAIPRRTISTSSRRRTSRQGEAFALGEGVCHRPGAYESARTLEHPSKDPPRSPSDRRV